jgi:electron transport complex protein RnfA
MEYFEIIIATIFVNNILLAQFLGNCPFLGTSKKMETAMGMAMAVIFVLVMAGVMTWLIFNYLLLPNNLVLPANHRLHPGDCLPGPIRRNVP